jgi:hypothetical protein
VVEGTHGPVKDETTRFVLSGSRQDLEMIGRKEEKVMMSKRV